MVERSLPTVSVADNERAYEAVAVAGSEIALGSATPISEQFLTDQHNTGFYDVPGLTSKPSEEWTADLSGSDFFELQPIVADNAVFVALDQGVIKYDVADGTALASLSLRTYKNTVPVVNADKNEVYISDTNGELFIHDTDLNEEDSVQSDGQLGTYDPAKEFIWTAVEGDAGLVDVGDRTAEWTTAPDSGNAHLITVVGSSGYFTDDQTVYSLAESDGSVNWKDANLVGGPMSNAGTCYNADDEYIHVVGDNEIVAIEADGSVVWRTSVTADQGEWRPTYHDGTVYMRDGVDSLVSLNASTGAENWNESITSDRIGGKAAIITRDVLYVQTGYTNPELVAVDPADGSVFWRFGGVHQNAIPYPADGAIYTMLESPNEAVKLT